LSRSDPTLSVFQAPLLHIKDNVPQSYRSVMVKHAATGTHPYDALRLSRKTAAHLTALRLEGGVGHQGSLPLGVLGDHAALRVSPSLLRSSSSVHHQILSDAPHRLQLLRLLRTHRDRDQDFHILVSLELHITSEGMRY
jgi:hypothetical protein